MVLMRSKINGKIDAVKSVVVIKPKPTCIDFELRGDEKLLIIDLEEPNKCSHSLFHSTVPHSSDSRLSSKINILRW